MSDERITTLAARSAQIAAQRDHFSLTRVTPQGQDYFYLRYRLGRNPTRLEAKRFVDAYVDHFVGYLAAHLRRAVMDDMKRRSFIDSSDGEDE